MTAGLAWLAAFPQTQASQAVHAVCEAWTHWASKPREGFHPGIAEPLLTRVVLNHVERVVAPALGLIGFWGTECVENEVDPQTGKITKETRTDILFAWNDNTQAMKLVFEFKKLSCTGGSRSHYLGRRGLLRFVTGVYSRQQAVSLMVGVLVAPTKDAVPRLRKSLQTPAVAGGLNMMQLADGTWLRDPSDVFPGQVDFDTEHERDPKLAPAHGTIRVGHLFLHFGYLIDAPPRCRAQGHAQGTGSRLTGLRSESASDYLVDCYSVCCMYKFQPEVSPEAIQILADASLVYFSTCSTCARAAPRSTPLPRYDSHTIAA